MFGHEDTLTSVEDINYIISWRETVKDVAYRPHLPPFGRFDLTLDLSVKKWVSNLRQIMYIRGYIFDETENYKYSFQYCLCQTETVYICTDPNFQIAILYV